MEKTEKVIFTNLCMLYDGEGNVLLEDREEEDWRGVTFPGGHVEPGESFIDAAVREVYEETGLTVSDLTLCGIKDWMQEDGTRYIVFCYKTCTFRGTLSSSAEGRVFWAPIADLPQFTLAEEPDVMLRLFCDARVSELFYILEHDKWSIKIQ